LNKALFVAWAPPSHTRRSELMARKLDIPLRRVHVLKMKRHLAPLRYVVQAFLALAILFRERPRVVFVQNPPVFAPLFAWVYCAPTRAVLIIDSHTDALQSRLWRWSLPLHRFLSRRALTTIVTNEHLGQIVARWGARSQMIIDVPSELPVGKPYPVEYPFNVAMVSSFAPDEPLDQVLEVARSLPEVGFYVTGDPSRSRRPLPTELPDNLHVTGFLPDHEYYGLLRSAQAVMALTTEDYTMQRGACEAVWLGQPIITSDWPLLRRAFHKGTIHVDNTVEGIRAGVSQMRARHQQLANEIVLLQEERRRQWEETAAWLDALICKPPVSTGRT
jgi:glycosyltransferase involved in cell wall biosynthesis